MKTNLSPEMNSFRRTLQAELVLRCQKNPSYSLRSLAKVLEVDASSLSKVLNGNRGMSHKKREEWSKKLGITMATVLPTMSESKDGATHQFTLDTFAMIADWYHHAIVQLIGLKSFQQDHAKIARSLGITKHEVVAAIDRLTRLKIIQVDEHGKWIVHESNMSTLSNPFTHAAFRKFQKQILTMGIDAMENIPIDLRDQTSMTMRMNSERMIEAKELIKKFRRDFCKIFEDDAECDGVYQLGVCFYPVTKIERRKKK